MIGAVYKHNKTGRVVTVENVTPDLKVFYRSPKGKKFKNDLNKFLKLYQEQSKLNPKECKHHRWSEVTLFTSTVKYCVLCDKKKE